MSIQFQPLRPEHLALLHGWLQKPHVRAFWDDGARTLQDVQSHYFALDWDVDPYLIVWQEEPIGYIQAYPVTPEHPFALHARGTTWGMDLFIGEEDRLGRGLGVQAVQAFVLLLEHKYGASRILIDPAVHNSRAIHIYQKAGFQVVAEMSVMGENLLLHSKDV